MRTSCLHSRKKKKKKGGGGGGRVGEGAMTMGQQKEAAGKGGVINKHPGKDISEEPGAQKKDECFVRGRESVVETARAPHFPVKEATSCLTLMSYGLDKNLYEICIMAHGA